MTKDQRPIDDTAELLLDFAQAMHRLSLPADMVEAFLDAIAKRFGVTADVMMLQSFLAAEVKDRTGDHIALRRIPFDAGWRLARMKGVIKLANACAAGTYSVAETRARLRDIMTDRPYLPRAAVIATYSVYCATGAARLGGHWLEMAAAAIVALVPAFFSYASVGRRTLDLQKAFIASFCAGAVVLACAVVFPAFDVGSALFGGLIMLVPATTITVATHELANDALESGTTRSAFALLRFAMLGAGVAGACKLWMLFAPMPALHESTPLPAIVMLPILIVGGLGLVILLHGDWSDAPWIVLGVVVAFGSQALTKIAFGGGGSPLIAAFLLGVVGHIYARFSRDSVPATVTVPGLLVLAPGFLGAQAVFALLKAESEGSATFFHMFIVAIQLIIGLVMASALFSRAKFAAAPAR